MRGMYVRESRRSYVKQGEIRGGEVGELCGNNGWKRRAREGNLWEGK